MVERYTESVDFEDSQKRYKAPLGRLADVTGGLPKDGQMPRPRIELGTRGFSVRQGHLFLEMLAYLAAVGQVAEQLMQELGSNDNRQAQAAELIQPRP